MKRAISNPDPAARRIFAGLIPEPARHLIPLALLGAGILYTNRWFSFIDDETLMLDGSAQPVRAIFDAFRSGIGMNEHPPLYDLLLHFWLRLTGGSFFWLRVPATIFLLGGLWILSCAARRIGGDRSATALLWLGALWPYGFHFGRLAGWYSFAFLLISTLTYAYLRYCSSPSPQQWAVICALALALIYTNYYGWALLALLGVDYWLRNRGRAGTMERLLLTATVLLIAFLPLWRTFVYEFASRTNFHQSWKLLVLNAGYNVYILLVSESVGPWFWQFGVPATLAVAASLLSVFLLVRGESRRFLIFAVLLVAVMAAVGILNTRRLMLVAPWFLLPTAVALGTGEKKYWRAALALSLSVAAGIGWYGTMVRRYYAAPRFIEPWKDIAVGSAGDLRDGATVLSNNESFFFYLTYAVQAPPSVRPWRFSGVLPDEVHFPSVWNADEWVAAGRPISSHVVWIRGISPPSAAQPLEDAADWIVHRCVSRIDRYLVRDPGYIWKQHFSPELGQLPWRIEIRQYDCSKSQTERPPQ